MDRARQRTLLGPGHDRLRSATVLVVGVGALGCPAATYLAGCGLALRLVDLDVVDVVNLPHQPLYREADVGRPKVEAAAEALRARDAELDLEAVHAPFDPVHLDDVDVVLDCTDDPGTRDWIHAACLEAGIPLVWGAVEGWEGQWATVPPEGPCLRCLWPSPGDAPSCADAGVLGSVPGLVATAQALAAVHVLLGDAPAGRLHLLDGRTGTTETVAIPHRPGCLGCGGPESMAPK